ncbi:MAG: hypothetical protein GEU98_11695 [Pseudonocardiaceae bacterium]|nr:hypothetical protein [Pseudonocardiaceae bacterium]
MPLSGEEIYQNFHNGRGGAGLGEAAGIVRNLADNYRNRAGNLTKLTGSLGSVWSGIAGGAAGRDAAPIAESFASTAPDMHTVQDLVQRQVSSFDSAKSSVQPVPPAPNKPGFWENLLSLGGDTFEARQAAHNSAAQHNVDVMNNYALATEYNTSGLPGGTGSSGAVVAGVGLAGAQVPGLTSPATPSGSFSGVLPIDDEHAGAGLADAGTGPDGHDGTGSGGGGTPSDDNRGSSGLAGSPVGGTHGGDNEQRWSSFLVDDDAGEVFGTDESTAPPVIGE